MSERGRSIRRRSLILALLCAVAAVAWVGLGLAGSPVWPVGFAVATGAGVVNLYVGLVMAREV